MGTIYDSVRLEQQEKELKDWSSKLHETSIEGAIQIIQQLRVEIEELKGMINDIKKTIL